jgi:lipoate-protein ligase A
MVKPIRPSEVIEAKKEIIPDEVIESFNEMIAEKWNGSYSNFTQKEVVDLIMEKFLAKGKDPHIKNDIYDKHWLDVEDIFRKSGWNVEYDKPGYNESYSANFTFSKKR